ncbi:ATP-binding protein [Glaciecola siphonariae]|uniref:histidine kinase n=1 Tax=Glaciecola siphonariae TaxID=521012 RepID=A0ABV9LSH4_9ALTE
MRISLVPKIILPVCLAFAALVYGVTSVLLNMFETEQLRTAQRNAIATASQTSMLLDVNTTPEMMKRITTIIALNNNVERTAIIAADQDEVLATSYYRYANHTLADMTEQMRTAYHSAKTTKRAHFTSLDDHHYAMAYPVAAPSTDKIDTLDLVIVTQYDTHLLDEQFRGYQRRLTSITGIFFVVLILVLYAVISICVKRPLKIFEQAIKRETEHSGFDQINIDSKDEFEDIANAYNQMLKAEEQSLLKAKAATQEAQMLADKKAQFVANMSHELRTPINGILGLTQLCENAKSTNELKQYLAQLMHSSRLLLATVDDVLDFSRLNNEEVELQSEAVELASMTVKIAKLARVMTDDKLLMFNVDLAHDCPFIVNIDAARIKQILQHLLKNAVKFTASGSVTLKVDFLWENPSSGQLRFTVQDTGIGIKPEHKPFIFDAFEQADTSISRKYGGSGLGLAICKELIGLMGGEIAVSSVPNQGSTFSISLPCHAVALSKYLALKYNDIDLPGLSYDDDAPACVVRFCETINAVTNMPMRFHINEVTSSHQNAPFVFDDASALKRLVEMSQSKINAHGDDVSACKELHILLVEDNEINAVVATTMLTDMGHKVSVAINGKEALALIKKHAFDAIIMDIQMPIMDGIEATVRIREQGLQLPIIGLSANVSEQDRQDAFAAGMNDYLHKPITREVLRESLRKELGARNLA